MLAIKKKDPENLFNLFEQIENTSGTNAKLDLISHANEMQQELIELALNPYKQFHITKWAEFGFGEKFVSDTEAYEAFIQVTDVCEVSNRSFVLESSVTEFFSRCDELQKKWFGRILRKDLRFGLLAKSMNKVFGKDFIPSFEVMLANPASSKDNPKDLCFVDFSRPIWAELKYDGFRTVAQYGDTLDVLGRSGKEIANEHFYQKLAGVADLLKGHMLDGEGYCHSLSFESLSSVLRTETANLPPDFRFVIFDTIPLGIWKARGRSDTLRNRLLDKKRIVDLYPEFFEMSEGREVKTPADIWAFYEEAIERGYEGLVLKYLDEPYVYDRSKFMLKVKPTDFVDMKVIGYYEGEGKIVGMLGGFHAVDEDGIEDRIGGGYKLWQRKLYWENPNFYIDKWIKVAFTERTEAGRLRHPRFRGFRDDKD